MWGAIGLIRDDRKEGETPSGNYQRSIADLGTSNIIERENREIRRREKVIGIFPNTESIIRLIGAILYDDHNDWSNCNRLFDMTEYYEKQSSILAKFRKNAA